MTEITCDVVKDLIPLYVDGALSDDSKRLVEKHLLSCKTCNDYYDMMKKDVLHSTIPGKIEDNVIKSIRRKINVSKFITAVSSACIVALVCGILFYSVCVRESYIPYEESQIFVENGILKSDNNYVNYSGYEISEDGKELFIYLSTTPYKKLTFSHNDTMELLHLANETPESYSRIFYLSEKYAKEFHNHKESILNENHDDVVEDSVLIWESAGL